MQHLSVAVIGMFTALVLSPSAVAQQAECLPGLEAHANADGSISLSWPPLANITAWQVLVREDGGDWFPITPQVTAGANSTTDSHTVAGHSYEFEVVALLGPSHPFGTFCPVFVDAIPFFPSAGAFALGAVGALGGAFLVLRRRC